MTETVFDVAQYILTQHGEMTAMKLQKLVYYSQAWHLAWHDNVLFPEPIQAWADGPVVPALFQSHRGKLRISRLSRGRVGNLSAIERNTIDKILSFYADKSPQWLSDLTHMEDPWKLARSGVPERASSNNVINPESMSRYYSSLSG